MLQGFINQTKRAIAELEAAMENPNLTPEQAEALRKAYEIQHQQLTLFTGDKGDRRPKDKD